MKDKNDTILPVLVVDDEPDLAGLIKLSFESEGIPCLTATSAVEACSVLKRQEIGLLLLDWRLEISGIEVLRACKDLHPDVPVIVMSAINPNVWDTKTDALLAGADSFLEKPFSPVFVKHGRQLLERYSRLKSLLPQREQDIVTLEEVKRLYTRHVVSLLEGNVTLAAERLGIHRHTTAAMLKEENSKK